MKVWRRLIVRDVRCHIDWNRDALSVLFLSLSGVSVLSTSDSLVLGTQLGLTFYQLASHQPQTMVSPFKSKVIFPANSMIVLVVSLLVPAVIPILVKALQTLHSHWSKVPSLGLILYVVSFVSWTSSRWMFIPSWSPFWLYLRRWPCLGRMLYDLIREFKVFPRTTISR